MMGLGSKMKKLTERTLIKVRVGEVGCTEVLAVPTGTARKMLLWKTN